MPEITFLPANITVEKSECSSLLEAARAAGVFVETPCGGSGTCQKCKVLINGQSVLICQTAVLDEDITVEISDKNTFDLNLAETPRRRDAVNINEALVKHLPESEEAFIKNVKFIVPSPALLDGLSDADRFSRAFLKEFPTVCSVDLPLNVLATLPEKLRKSNGEVIVHYFLDNDIVRIITINPNLPSAFPASSRLCESSSLSPSSSAFPASSRLCESSSLSPSSSAFPAFPRLCEISPPSPSPSSSAFPASSRLCEISSLSSSSSASPASQRLCESFFGISVDIGTTTIAVWLIDMETKKIITVHNAYNSQIECGLDVISRINYAKKNLGELKTRILKTINELIQSACKEASIEPEQILCVSMAGNTVMTHLLLGIIPEYLRLSPYTPAVFQPQIYSAEQVGIKICENALVLFAPAVGSYVGGDITAGLLCTCFAEAAKDSNSNDLILFIDIGTNGEIVLGNNDFIFACACSAGPAFEGGGIKHGVRACNGAIDRVMINENGEIKVRTINGEPPIGICGSGIISAIAEMFRKGIIDSAGKLSDPKNNGEYELCEGLHGSISICETDIDNFIRAKGAIFSACQTMLDSVGMSFKEVNKIYVAGGFGNHLDLEDARTIGLLPRLPSGAFTFLGNSSCNGAYFSMVSEKYRAKLQEIAGKITYVDLSSEAKYMDHYTAALFLPHTDKALFE